MTKCGAENLSATALTNNQLLGYGYDAAGNMTSDPTDGVSSIYDAENRIATAAKNGVTTAYTYDSDGNRVKKSSGGTGTLYWYMAPGIVGESDLSGTLTAEYVFFDGERVARKDFPGNAVSYYFSDHLKTASVITDSAGNIKAESDYYPWGGELQFLANDSNHYKFTGKERDSESGLDYFGARYYSNGLGRFITPDWAAKPAAVPYAVLGDPQSLNLYTYVRNIPTSQIDSDGHCPPCSPEDWSNGRIIVDPVSGVAMDMGDPAGNMKYALIASCASLCTMAAMAAPELIAGSVVARSLLGLGTYAAYRAAPIIGGALEGLVPGPPGSLTIAAGSRLTAQEISAGTRYANQSGKALVESAHKGEEFVDAAKKTYDVMGQPGAYSHWTPSNVKDFMGQIVKHVNKVDKTIIDLKGASKAQIKEIKDFVKTLTKEQQKKVDYVK